MIQNKAKFLGIILLMLLVISSVCLLTISASTAEVAKDLTTKGLEVLNKVAGYNSTRYNITTISVTDSSFIDTVPVKNSLPAKNLQYTLESANNHVEVLETFVNDKLEITKCGRKCCCFPVTNFASLCSTYC